MNRICFIYLILFFISVTHLSTGDEENEDESSGDNILKATPVKNVVSTAPKAQRKGGDEEGEGESGGGGGGGGGGAPDTQCKCCAGWGIKCGTRLKFCGGGDDCRKDKLYYCDPKTKKTYIYEQCHRGQRCLMDENQDLPDYCAIKMDKSFLYVREDNIKKWKENFNKTFEEYMKKFEQYKEDIKEWAPPPMKDDSKDDEDEEDVKAKDKHKDKHKNKGKGKEDKEHKEDNNEVADE